LAKKSKIFDGLGLKSAILSFIALSPTSLKYFKSCRRQCLKISSAFADSAKKDFQKYRFLIAVGTALQNFVALSAVSLENLKRCRQQAATCSKRRQHVQLQHA
jgi:hypothetical protein